MALAACVALTRGSNFQAGWFKWLACCSLPTLSPVEYGSGPLSRHGPRTLTRAHHDAARASPSVHPPDCQWTLVSAVTTRLVPTEKPEPGRQRARPGTDINRDLNPDSESPGATAVFHEHRRPAAAVLRVRLWRRVHGAAHAAGRSAAGPTRRLAGTSPKPRTMRVATGPALPRARASSCLGL